jgi:hypothetical protein
VKNEILNLELVKEFTINENVLIIKDNDRYKVYTLTEESKIRLDEYLKNVK